MGHFRSSLASLMEFFGVTAECEENCEKKREKIASFQRVTSRAASA